MSTDTTDGERPETTAAPAPEPFRAAVTDGDGLCTNVVMVLPGGSFDPGDGLHLEELPDGSPVGAGWAVDAQGAWSPPRASTPDAPEAVTLEGLQAQLDRLRQTLAETTVRPTLAGDFAGGVARGAVSAEALAGALRWGVITEGEHYDLTTARDQQEARRGEARA